MIGSKTGAYLTIESRKGSSVPVGVWDEVIFPHIKAAAADCPYSGNLLPWFVLCCRYRIAEDVQIIVLQRR